MKKTIILTATAAMLIFAVSCGQQQQQPKTADVKIEEFTHTGAGDVNCEDYGNETDYPEGGKHPIDIRMDKELDENSSTGGVSEAYENANHAWEAEMSKNYQNLMELLDSDGCRVKLQAAQNAWLAFRDEEMAFNSGYWNLFSGTMFANASSYYRLYLVRQRAFELAYYFKKDYYIYDSYFDENTDVKTEEEWDKLLNKNYKLLIAKLSKNNQDKLRVAQRKWIALRDAENDCYNSCNMLISNPDHLLLIIRERALRLGKYLNDLNDLF